MDNFYSNRSKLAAIIIKIQHKNVEFGLLKDVSN